VNLPDTAVTAPVLDDDDRAHLVAALDAGADLVALSFVRQAGDADVVRAAMDEVGRRVPVIAKIERADAVSDLEAIVEAFDGVMVARGDLGVEVDLAIVPLVQKRIITACRRAATPVIVATEMLESMAHAARPTRAEASDVVNAILDGTDAVMLSGETSVGDHPAEVVATMAHLVEVAETVGEPPAVEAEPDDADAAVVRAAVDLAASLPGAVLAVLTRTGSTARRASALRPPNRLIVVSPPDGHEAWGLLWGVETIAGSLDADASAAQLRSVLSVVGDVEDAIVIALAGEQPGRTDVIRRLDPT
jgi:pyruvate kinase